MTAPEPSSTDAHLQAVVRQAEAELMDLRRVAQQLHAHSHELVNLLQGPLGELDLAVIHLRRALDEFYLRHPELGG